MQFRPPEGLRLCYHIAMFISLPVFDALSLGLGLGLGLGIPGLILVVLLFFFLLRGQRYRRNFDDLSSRYESTHGVLFGQVSQYISRLEAINQRNFTYADTYINLNNKFKDLKDYKDAECVSYIRHLSDALTDHDYSSFRQGYPEARRKIADFETAVASFSKNLSLKFEDEKKAQGQYLASQAALRKIKEAYFSFQSDAGMLMATFEAFFTRADALLSEAESLIDRASYDEATDILENKLNPALKALDGKMEAIPEMCLQLTSVLPSKIISLKNTYEELAAAGYPLHHIIVDGTIDELENEVNAMSERLRGLALGGLSDRIDLVSGKIQGYLDAFEKEEAARKRFEEEFPDVYRSSTKLDNDFLQLNHAIPKAQELYLFSDDDKAAIEETNAAINRVGAVRRRLDNLIHSGTKQPFTVLLARLDSLNEETQSTKKGMDAFTMRLRSFKSDVDEAAALLTPALVAAREAEADLAEAGIPALDARYAPMIGDIRSYVEEASSILRALPIDVEKVSASHERLAKALDRLDSSLHGDLQAMQKAEGEIVEANRYRGGNEALADSLRQAETLFYQADFEKAYQLAAGAKSLASKEQTAPR